MRFPTMQDAARVSSFFTELQKPLGGGLAREVSDPRFLPAMLPELPGGSPFSLCAESRPTDLFEIYTVILDTQPLHIDDVFIVYLYGTFKDTWGPENATLDFTIDCGSHCEEYGHVPGDPKGETNRFDLCEFSQGLEQPLGGRKKNETCPPEPGPAMIPYAGFVWPFPFHVAMWYNFTFDAKTADGQRIYCVTTEVCLRWADEEKNERYGPHGPWNNCTWPR